MTRKYGWKIYFYEIRVPTISVLYYRTVYVPTSSTKNVMLIRILKTRIRRKSPDRRPWRPYRHHPSNHNEFLFGVQSSRSLWFCPFYRCESSRGRPHKSRDPLRFQSSHQQWQ